MPRGDEAILRQASGIWADGPAIRWLQQLRTTIAGNVRRVKPARMEAATPTVGKVTSILVLVILVLSLGIYAWRQRFSGPSVDSTPPRPEATAPAAHGVKAAQAAQDAQPPRPDAARAYPRSYSVLLVRSIFSANGMASRRSTASASPAPAAAQMPSLSLKGISQEDTRFTAFVEDATANKIFTLRVGDTVGPGRVCDITLHDLTFDVSGNRQRLEIDNISGKSGPPVPDPALSAAKSKKDGESASNQDGSIQKKKKKHSE